ncbi:MAG TPA: imidazole glycerol phosphate synthase subunit HisF [Acidimicrobiia bacterium]|nr:imidazole glycerol phosphate synthase subunit HisF [Acidimicrobiia bacterium]
MLAKRVVPCLDIDSGRVVKGVRFSGLRDAGDPVESAAVYEAQGADEVILLDVSATPQGRAGNLEVVSAVREVLSIPLTVGGGVRDTDDVARLLTAGADKVGINTAAVERPELIAEVSMRFGAQCTVVAVDAAARNGGWEVVVRSGAERTGFDAIEWCSKAAALGAGELLLTSWDRDGTGDGYELDLVAQVAEAVSVPVIASGGAAGSAHMIEAFQAGASAALIASILHDGLSTVDLLKRDLLAAGVEVRP